MSKIEPQIMSQLEALTLDPHRPLIISDADEVLLKFMERVEVYLESIGLWIDLQNFGLTNNIKSRDTNEPVKIPKLIDDFFAAETPHIEAADTARCAQTRPTRHHAVGD